MAEWLVEQGIAEDRAILVERGEIVAARVCWGGAVRCGAIVDARLVHKAAGKRRGTARLDDGTQVLVDQLPRDLTEGMAIRLRITREAIAERGRNKLAQGRAVDGGQALRPAPSLLDGLAQGGTPVSLCRPGDGRFAAAGWDELVDEALGGQVGFAGGELLISATPAMTLFDIDGDLPGADLALAAVPAIAATLRRLDIAGSVGIDFPTLPEKAARQAVDALLAAHLADWPHERTGMNGFGFVHLVARLERPSILALYQRAPVRAALERLARRAEAVSTPGAALELRVHPALARAASAPFSQELERRTGRTMRWIEDPSLALAAPGVQAVPA